MVSTAFVEAMHPTAPLISVQHALSIDEAILSSTQPILVGQVLGAAGVTADYTLVAAAAAGNTGTTTIGTVSAATSAQNGIYQIMQLATSSTGAIEVQRPDGTADGHGVVGTPYTGQITFTLTAGGTATIGDMWTVTVTRPFEEGGEVLEAWSPIATDGSQTAVAVALYPYVPATSPNAKIAVVRRDAVVRLADLTFGSASFTGSISTTTLTVTAMAPGSGPICLGATLAGAGVTASTTITAVGTGTGGVGTYTVNNSQSVSSEALTSAMSAAQIAMAQQQLAAKSIVCR